MSWVAVGVGVGGAVVGAVGSNMAASKAAKAAKGAGQVDIYHENQPWGPSAQIRENLMQRANNVALQQLDNPTTFGDWLGARGGQLGGGGGGGGKRRGGGGGQTGPAFNGVSPSTQKAIDAASALAERGNPLYGEAEDYISGTLAGEDQNPYRAETFGAMRDVNDPDLARLKEYLFGQLGVGGAGGDGLTSGSGRGGGYSNFTTMGGGGGGGGEGPVGSAAYIKKMLDEQYGSNPFLQQSINDALDDEQRAFASRVIPGLNSQFAGAGAFGGSMYQQALAQAGEAQARGLAKESNTRRAQDYNDWQARRMQALGFGTELDINAANAAASRAGSASAAASAADRLALEKQMGLISALGGAVGEGVDLRKFGLSGMGSLSGMLSEDQKYALGMTPDITGLSLRDWTGAGGLSLSADKNRADYSLGQQDIAARRAAANAANRLANQQFQFDVFRDERGYPLASLGGASDIVNILSGGYGTSHEYGTDRRSQSPYTGSVGGQTVSGALGGALAGWQLYNQYGGGGGGNRPNPTAVK